MGAVNGRPVEISYGSAWDELEQFGDRVDLLVCGSRHNGALLRHLLGSTSEDLARRPRTPVLITPAQDDAMLAG